MNLDRILASFNKTVVKLNKYADSKVVEEVAYLDDAIIATKLANEANVEAARARKISGKIEDLISGE